MDFLVDAEGHVKVLGTKTESRRGFGEACERVLAGHIWTPALDAKGQPKAQGRSRFLCEFEITDPAGQAAQAAPVEKGFAAFVRHPAPAFFQLEVKGAFGALDAEWLECLSAGRGELAGIHRIAGRVDRNGRIAESRWAAPPPALVERCMQRVLERVQFAPKATPTVFALELNFSAT